MIRTAFLLSLLFSLCTSSIAATRSAEEIRAVVYAAHREAIQNFKNLGSWQFLVTTGILIAGEVAESGHYVTAEQACKRVLSEQGADEAQMQRKIIINNTATTKYLDLCSMGFNYTMALIER